MALLPYLVRRLGSSALAVVGVCLLVFSFLHLVPGDPVDNLAGGDVTPEQRADLEACLGLDQPLLGQLARFAGHVVDGSLGRQCPDPKRDKPPVSARVAEVFPYTLELALAGIAVAIVLALPLGVVAAVRSGTLVDAAASFVSLAGISFPVPLMGPLFLSIFYVDLAWFPGPGEADQAGALFLPAIVVGTHLMAMLARMTRSSLLDVLAEDYLQTARAKGLPAWRVVLQHGLRNALLPVITIVGLQFGAVLAGATVTETVFARPGLGSLLLEAIRQRNYPVVQGTVLVVAVLTVTVNLVVDLAYGVADPRIRHG